MFNLFYEVRPWIFAAGGGWAINQSHNGGSLLIFGAMLALGGVMIILERAKHRGWLP